MSGTINNVLNTAGRTVYQLAYQISPIIFTDGIAGSSFGALPIALLTEAIAFGNGTVSAALTGSTSAIPSSLDDFFAHFTPVPGGKLASYSVGMYPFANQSVAANAIIAEPLAISMRMNIPVRGAGGYVSKFLTMAALQAAVQKHAMLGGTYTIATPAAFYTNCILTSLTDITSGNNPTPQNAWQWDFVQPLVTLQAAQQAGESGQLSSQLSKFASGVYSAGSTVASSTTSLIPNTLLGTSPSGIIAPSGLTGSALGSGIGPAPSVGG